MADLIATDPILDNSVYGVQQVQYTVDGVHGKDFIDALTAASFWHATSIEEVTSSYAAVVRARQTKISELGDVLSIISEAAANLKVKKGESEDYVTVNNADWVKAICNKYSISLSWVVVLGVTSNVMSRTAVWKAQTDVQYQIDKEDNNLQQDLVSLQSYITKRDNAYSNAAKVVRKANNAASSTISNIGK